jgi:predicted AAA+ superfamily ATPase
MYFWRTAAGLEVDLIIETQGKLVPIEVKLTATPRPEMAATIASFNKDYGDRVLPGYVVHPGKTVLPLGQGVIALPFAML